MRAAPSRRRRSPPFPRGGCAPAPATGKTWRSYGPVARLERSLPSVCSSGVKRTAADSASRRCSSLGAGELDLGERVIVQVAAPRRAGRRAAAIPAARRSAGSPTPERCRIAGVPYAPAASTTVPASMRTSSPSRHTDHLHARLRSAPSRSQSARSRIVRLSRPRAGSTYANDGVEPDSRLDVDRLDAEADAAVEVVEVVRPAGHRAKRPRRGRRDGTARPRRRA